MHPNQASIHLRRKYCTSNMCRTGLTNINKNNIVTHKLKRREKKNSTLFQCSKTFLNLYRFRDHLMKFVFGGTQPSITAKDFTYLQLYSTTQSTMNTSYSQTYKRLGILVQHSTKQNTCFENQSSA